MQQRIHGGHDERRTPTPFPGAYSPISRSPNQPISQSIYPTSRRQRAAASNHHKRNEAVCRRIGTRACASAGSSVRTRPTGTGGASGSAIAGSLSTGASFAGITRGVCRADSGSSTVIVHANATRSHSADVWASSPSGATRPSAWSCMQGVAAAASEGAHMWHNTGRLTNNTRSVASSAGSVRYV